MSQDRRSPNWGWLPADVGRFTWCTYWATWDLILSVHRTEVKVVALTPINGDWAGEADRLGQPRVHMTALNLKRGDRIEDRLPPRTEAEVRAHGLGRWLNYQAIGLAGGRCPACQNQRDSLGYCPEHDGEQT